MQRASNGGDNGVASLSQELQHRLELKDEEARKYREQYENAARQLQVTTYSHRNKFLTVHLRHFCPTINVRTN